MQQDKNLVMDTKSVDAITDELDLWTAQNLAADGQYDEAEAVTCRATGQPTSIAAKDLLARIAVQQGDLRRARQLWSEVLEGDPKNGAAQLAMSRLNSSWLVFALLRRLTYLVALGVTVSLSLVGLVAFFSHQRLAADVGAHTPVAVSPPAVRISDAVLPETAPSISIVELLKPPPSVIDNATIVPAIPPLKKPPVFTIKGCTVSTNATETIVHFDDGLFARRAELTESGRIQLETAAQIVVDKAQGYWIVVEGHTDSDPMPPNNTYKDNYALGLHRAMVATEVVKDATSLAGKDVLAVSPGEDEAPFVGDDNESKQRNRTVVIRLVPKVNGALQEASE